MTGHRKLAVKLALAVAGALFVGLFLIPRGTIMHAQERRQQRVGMPTDWSHRHMIYSAPQTMPDAWRLQSEPRYVSQLIRRNFGMGFGDRGRFGRPRREQSSDELRPDWGASAPVLPAGTAGNGVYPAKYTFDLNAAPSCANDFLVIPTGTVGAATTIAARATGIFSAEPTTGATITITNGANSATLTASAATTATTFARSATVATNATNLASAINLAHT